MGKFNVSNSNSKFLDSLCVKGQDKHQVELRKTNKTKHLFFSPIAEPVTVCAVATSLSVYALDELLLHHTVEGDVGQVRDEGVAGSSADAFTTSEVQQSQRGQTLQVGQTAVCELAATWTDRHRDEQTSGALVQNEAVLPCTRPQTVSD